MYASAEANRFTQQPKQLPAIRDAKQRANDIKAYRKAEDKGIKSVNSCEGARDYTQKPSFF